MLALSLSLSLFGVWGVVGVALLAALNTRRNLLQNLLLAPVAGVAATLLPIFLLSRAGLPVGRFGVALTAALLVLSAAMIWRLRPIIPFRRSLPFAGILAPALIMTGWPMLEFGFDWVSYANDDMANYVLAGHRFLHHGFMDVPDAEELVRGRDYSLFYWFLDAVHGHRPGGQLLLAWVASLTGLTGHQIFMPLILALHLVLISATGALVCQSRRYRLSAQLTCGLLGVSALASLGVLYQLIAQVSGLGLLAGCGTVLLRPLWGVRVRDALRQSVLSGLLIAALLILYPEVLPFLAVAVLLYLLVMLLRRRLTLRPLTVALASIIVATLALPQRYLVSTLMFLLRQMRGGFKTPDPQVSLFPYYLIPSGLANLWGLQKITALPPEPWLSTSILLGAVLLVGVTAGSVMLTWRGQPVATMTMAMFGAGISLVVYRADFGLFKLAMILQPFMLGTLVLTWFSLVRRPGWRIRPLILLGVLGLYSQIDYVERSRGVPSRATGAFLEIPDGSRSRINSEFQRLVASTDDGQVLLDSQSIVLAKFQALYTRGKNAAFPSRDFFARLTRRSHADSPFADPLISTNARSLEEHTHRRLSRASFDLHDTPNPAMNEFVTNTIGQRQAGGNECGLLIGTTGRHSIVNRRQFSPADSRNFIARPCHAARNHLIFTHSHLGEHYYGGDARRTAIYQLEPDWFLKGRSMSGVGRHLLFQVINPSRPMRLLLEVTASLKADGDNRLPPAAAIGASRESFPIVGRGSARVFSPPLTPQTINDRAYVAIDMGVDGQRFPDRRRGLMRLYGSEYPRDRRLLVGFARDISSISEEDYARLAPPPKVDTFPADLLHPGLEYSGFYEDGWVSEEAFVYLSQPREPAVLVARGVVPAIGASSFSTELRLSIDGQEIARIALAPGDFDLRLAAPSGTGHRRIDLRFSHVQRLPGRDRRPVAARLQLIGFESAARPQT